MQASSIDEIRELKRTLQAQQVRNDALFNSLGEGLITIDTDGNIAQINSYALDALGYSEKDLIGQWFPKAITAVDDYGQPIELIRSPVTRALTEGKPISDYSQLLRRDGSMMPVLLTVSPILIDDKPAGAIEVFRDLTKERELDLAKDDFVSLASHQLRTPATGVKAILSMLHKGNFGAINDQQRKYLEMAIASNDRQLNIIENLLSVARADAGTLDLDLDYIDVSALVHGVASEHITEIKRRDQTLKLEVPPSAHAVADGQKVQMVIDNLISNASKYTPHGGHIEVGLFKHPTKIAIRVGDTGVGISKHQIETAFAKFGRVENELSATGGGTGLGLYLAKKVVALHNGDIRVQSRLGHGSVFEVILPKQQ